ncbi:hypothetical protein [Haloferax volcanii]|uniref:hypothetical protein n=1 Tax=Haloferax volcanii TaxID=2246 RepID=UPI0023D9F1C8|nr:hypothetical protein [Haloferax lucentense]WEL24492.1 putative membrane protein [Haloferax lucentense]
MSRTVRETLAEAYDPDPRAMAIVAMGSSFLLVSLLSNPSSNPSHLFGLVVAVLSLVVSVVVLAGETRR